MSAERISEILKYQFKNGGLLSDALTHPSRRKAKEKNSAYERLEFLGDRVLGLVIAEMLLPAFPDESEGDLAKRHAGLVRAEACANVAKQWELDAHLLAASSEFTDGKIQNHVTLGDAAEAMIGALYLDSNFETAAAIIARFWSPLLGANLAPPVEAKSALQEWAQGRGLPLPLYTEIKRSGPVHAPKFTVEVSVEGIKPSTNDAPLSAQGTGTSLRTAEKAAAEALLKKIKKV